MAHVRLCRDATLLQAVWQTYDVGKGKPIYTNLVSSMCRTISEKRAELGVNSQMQGLGVAHNASEQHLGQHQGYLDMGFNVVSSAANAGVNTVTAMMGSGEEGVLDSSCRMKVQW